MEKQKDTGYTWEQIKDAEQTARILKSIPEDKEKIIVIMTHIFISGMEAGVRLCEKR